MKKQVVDRERWVPVEGYEGIYQVSDKGRVRSLDREILLASGHKRKVKGRMLSPRKCGVRYHNTQVVLCDGETRRAYSVARLVWFSWMSRVHADKDITHINKDWSDNRLENLKVRGLK